MQKARRHPNCLELRPIVSARFQVLFHSSIRSTFHLSLTVLVRYRSLRNIQPYQMVLADSHRISPVPRYSGYCQVVNLFRVRDYHPLWFNFPEVFHYKFTVHIAVLQPHICRNNCGLGYSPFARHYLGNHYCFLFLWLLRCFSSPGSLPTIARRISCLQQDGLPHSEISGSKVICTSPKLIAAYHVLHRL